MPRRRPRVGAILLLVAVATLAAGCKSGFRSAAETVATNVGRSADEVEQGFIRAMPGATESQLEAAASKAATDTAWIKTLAARLRAEWEEQATLRAIAGSTCDYLGLLQDYGEATTPQQIRDVLRKQIQMQQLAESDAKVIEIAEGVEAQIDALINRGTVDVDEALQDLACLPF
jgi:hypothetical protein